MFLRLIEENGKTQKNFSRRGGGCGVLLKKQELHEVAADRAGWFDGFAGGFRQLGLTAAMRRVARRKSGDSDGAVVESGGGGIE